jgi:hypothetical protein
MKLRTRSRIPASIGSHQASPRNSVSDRASALSFIDERHFLFHGDVIKLKLTPASQIFNGLLPTPSNKLMM